MGLAASQCRYLSLTSRKNDIEGDVQRLTYEQTELNEMTQKIAQEYNDKLSNTKLVYNTYGENGEALQKIVSYDLITSDEESGGLNMRIVDSKGNVVIPKLPKNTEYLNIKDNSTGIYTKVKDSATFISNFMPGISEEELEVIKDYKLSALQEYWQNSQYYSDAYSVNVVSSVRSDMKSSEERYLIDEKASDVKYLYDKLSSNEWHIEKREVLLDKSSWEELNWYDNSVISTELDTTDDKEAEAKYTKDMADITTRQKRLDYQLKELETEHQAVEKELDSVLKVIQGNIEKSYDKFSS